jgi:hypothetical protein
MVARLSDYPFVVVRVRCRFCNRAGQYRLARLAAKFGPEITLPDLLDRIAFDCAWRTFPGERPPNQYDPKCGAWFVDLGQPRRPPDLPRDLRGFIVVKGGKSS